MIITIDGPAASGKSAAAQALAQKLNFYYLYSGYLYRSCAYVLSVYARYDKTTIANPKPEDVATFCNPYRLQYRYTLTDGPRVFFDDQDITSKLKNAKIDTYASLLSANEAVRIEINAIQHAVAQGHNLIADGRDMGTVVFPQAEVKFFLTASTQERARRWRADQEKKGNMFSEHEAEQAIMERDQRDTIRPHAPLVVAADAHTIDNTNLTKEQTLAMMVQIVEKQKAV